MSRTPVRKVGELAGLSRAERLGVLRARMAEREGGDPQPTQVEPEVIRVVDALARALPGRGLARRSVTEVTDCPALIVELISHATAGGGRVAVVGWPELSLAGVVEKGCLGNVILVPDPGPDPLGIIAVLVDGLDLVIARWATPVALSPARARPLLGKLRSGTAALVLVDARVAATVARIDARVTTYRGIGPGRGRIRGIDIAVRVEARGHRPATTTVTVGQRPRLRAV